MARCVDLFSGVLLTQSCDRPTVLPGLSRDPLQPLSQALLDPQSFKTPLLLALVSAKHTGELVCQLEWTRRRAFSCCSDSILCLDPNCALVFPTPPHSSEVVAELHPLCMYVQLLVAFCCTQQLFVCYSDSAKGQTLSRSICLAGYVRVLAYLAYTGLGLVPPLGVRAHSTRGLSARKCCGNRESLQKN